MTRVPRERWSARELHHIRQTYTWGGAHMVHESLTKRGYHRTHEAIRGKARALGLYIDYTRKGKYAPLAEAHPTDNTRARTPHPDILAAAQADGVLTRAHLPPYPYLAPAEWVDAYMARLETREAHKRLVRGTWLTTTEAARAFGVTPGTLSTVTAEGRIRKGLLGRIADTVTRELLMRPHANGHTLTKYWHPSETMVAAGAYRAACARSTYHRSRRGRAGGRPRTERAA